MSEAAVLRPSRALAAADVAERIVASLATVVHAPAETLRLPLLCLLAQGHVLVEDVPGVGKTVLAKTLARTLDLGFSRLQFTPDLLPSDVTSVNVYDQQAARFRFRSSAHS
ncbi:MAG: AAA family ATPase [Thermoleophilia bacterium]|nr:AAA family ATPase [Thermoleophilia bacterium]